MFRSAITLCLALALSVHAAAAQEFKLVVNEANSTAITKQLASNIFMGAVKTWPGGVEAVPVDLPEKSAVRQAFSSAIIGRDVKAVSSHWLQEVFSGRSVRPAQRDGDAGVMEWVKANPGGIGYVSADASVPAGVKVVAIK
jgi:ABC-type phosphate transport system substrate-binding protein